MSHLRVIKPICAAWMLLAIVSAPAAAQVLTGKVIDETGVAVAGVKVSLTGNSLKAPLATVSDDAGRFLMAQPPPGLYGLKAEKPGYYATVSRNLEIKEGAASLEVIINHMQEFEETVNVVYSAPVVDRKEASAATSLTAEEITDLPIVSTHDFRNSLPLIPGVVKDNNGRIHLNGGGEDQAYYSLDGFNVTSPVSGILQDRISVDAIRTVSVETSRYSAEYGKGSAGVLALESSQGDDRFRFSSTNFIPSFELTRGLVISNWNPRATVSGPILKGRAWFFNALDLQYDLNTIRELPPGEDTNPNWFGSNLTRIQVNLSGKNILTGGFLFNIRSSRHFGISQLDPMETSRNLSERTYFVNLKDQAYLSGGWILETGVAFHRIRTREDPLGDALYVISPEGRSGNYFMRSAENVSRIQALATVLPPMWNWHGRHSFKFGVDGDRIEYRQFSFRAPFEIRGTSTVVSRTVSFQGDPYFSRKNAEFSGFLQDRWTLNDQAFVEAGMRFDWDQILRQPLWSPRLAFTWGPSRFPDSKFSAGVGVFYDATSLGLLARAMNVERSDTFYDEARVPWMGGAIISRFAAEDRSLRAPFYLNWSLGWQQRLGRGYFLQSNFIRKIGRRGWSFNPASPPASANSLYVYHLGTSRHDSYSYVEVELSRTFKGKYPWLLSYARSSARTSEVIDFSLDNPLFALQAGGPFDWDTPNRLISWSVLPLPRLKKYSLAYFAEWHSGYPWSEVNQFQQLVGAPNSRRFPEYFSLNLHVERRLRFWRCEWALRIGFNNITGRQNPTVVNNNVDAAEFGQYIGSQRRVFTGRIRFLGRN